VRGSVGTAHAVLGDPAEVVALVRVDERVVDADVREHPDENQRVHRQASQRDLEVGAEDARIAPLGDHVIVGTQAQELGVACGQLLSFEAVDVLRAVEFASGVDHVPAMHFLEEDHGDPTGSGALDQCDGRVRSLGVVAHQGNRRLLPGRLIARSLHVDGQQFGQGVVEEGVLGFGGVMGLLGATGTKSFQYVVAGEAGTYTGKGKNWNMVTVVGRPEYNTV
jgi:hypothetical protein